MITAPVSLSVELTVQWERILRMVGRGIDGLRCRVSEFVHRVVVHRGDEDVRGSRSWIREDPLVHAN